MTHCLIVIGSLDNYLRLSSDLICLPGYIIYFSLTKSCYFLCCVGRSLMLFQSPHCYTAVHYWFKISYKTPACGPMVANETHPPRLGDHVVTHLLDRISTQLTVFGCTKTIKCVEMQSCSISSHVDKYCIDCILLYTFQHEFNIVFRN